MAAVPSRSLDDFCPSRRTVVRALLALGGAVLVPGVVTACSSGGDDAPGDQPPGAAGGSVDVSAVAVGTAVVVDVEGERFVLAQPTEGEYVAFSARCTHQGTPVEAGDGLVLTCPNHGSVFDAGDEGAVLNGPATSPLVAATVTLEGDQLVLG